MAYHSTFSILPGNVFACRDINLAAVLATLKFPVKGINIQIEGLRPHPVGYFLFDNTDELNLSCQKFWSSSLSLEPNAFILNWKSLKSEVASLIQSPSTPYESSTDNLNKNFPTYNK